MLFTKIKLENYGLFRGEHEFDLTPKSNDHPIILFGGKNGSGKTTLFEAFRLCLYGNTFQGIPMSRKDYEEFLHHKLHRFPGIVIQPDIASISIEFRYSQFGTIERYVVKRYWKERSSSNIKEALEVYRDGEPLSDIEKDQWQGFVKELIPPALTKFFFFDGEQIQQLAQDQKNNLYLQESFDSLLGLDIVDRLGLDLKILLSDLTSSKQQHARKELQQLIDEKDGLERRIKQLENKRAQTNSRIEQIRGKIEEKNLSISKEGGNYASKRQTLDARQRELASAIEETRNHIKQMCERLLPFVLCHDYCLKLKERIIKEDNYEHQVVAGKLLQDKLRHFEKKLLSDDFWRELNVKNESLKSRFLNKTLHLLEDIVNESFPTVPHIKDKQLVHNISSLEKQDILRWISEVTNVLPSAFAKLAQKLEQLTRERDDVTRALSRVPRDEVLSPLVRQLNKLNYDLGEEDNKLNQIGSEIRPLESRLEEVKRRVGKVFEKQDRSERLSMKVDLAEKAQLALKDYISIIRREKIKALCDNLLLSLNHLSNKKIYEKVTISAEDFSVVLYQTNGHVIPKNRLSAGEKQIYAIAMLWALAKTSGKPLPFIIDTPLARLDSDHRSNLVSRFFPVAGHQVMIFSTDTEIDKGYFEELKPSTSQAYHLEYSSSEGMTRASEGYFWRVKQEVSV